MAIENIVPFDPWRLNKEPDTFDPNRTTFRRGQKDVTEMVSFRLPLYLKREMTELLDQSKLAHIEIKTISDFMVDATVLMLERLEALNIEGQQRFSTTRKMQRQRQLSEDRSALLEDAEETLDLLSKQRDMHGISELLETLINEQECLTSEPQSYKDNLTKLIERSTSLLRESAT